MKVYLIFCLFLFIPFFVLSEIPRYNCSNYSASSKNENLSNISIVNNNTGESAVYITKNDITITDSNITKIGDNINHELYGINTAILVNGGGLKIIGGKIATLAKGSSALVSSFNGDVRITGTNIISTGASYSLGLHAIYRGSIIASNVVVNTSGNYSSSLSIEYGEGTVMCIDCILETSGLGSPLIYSTGSITVSNTKGIANKAQSIVIEGKNSVTINSSSYLKCNANPNNINNDQCGILMHQSKSINMNTSVSSFICQNSTVEILSSSSYFSNAPMFFVSNIDANINLNSCNFIYGSNIFLKIDKSDLGDNNSNGRTVTLTLKNQDILGDIIVGSNCSLNIILVNSTIKGTMNGNKSASKFSIILDSDSSITLTGNSYYTSFKNYISNNSNINTGNYTWKNYEASASTSINRKRINKTSNDFSSSSYSLSSDNEEEEIDEDAHIVEAYISILNPSKLKSMLLFILFIDCILFKIIIK